MHERSKFSLSVSFSRYSPECIERERKKEQEEKAKKAKQDKEKKKKEEL